MNLITPRGSAACLLLFASATLANDVVPVSDSARCMDGPMAQFGRYIGNWNIADSTLSQDTGQWEPGAGARWNFVCLGGTAVQDFWLPPDGKVGTNLRTWNAETESWDIAWTITGMPGFAHIGAKQDEAGNIVMEYVRPVPEPNRRITFLPPDSQGWDWKLEMFINEQWVEVYRIRATPADQN